MKTVPAMNLTDEQLNKIFELASMEDKISKNDITSTDITEALIEIESKLYAFTSGVKIASFEDKKILIADDLELSIYQLSTVLKKIGIVPCIARHKDEAVSELQKVCYDCVIIDLFLPDSSDGIDLIKEAMLKKKEHGKDTKIIVISGTDDNSLVEQCYGLGIDFFIQKDKDWHSKLLKYMGNIFQSEKSLSYSRYVIDNKITSFILKKFNDEKVFNAIIKNINSSVITGIKNVLFDLREITSFDSENVYIFAEIYKICAENGGKFIIVNPSNDIKEALSFAYLEGVVPVAPSFEEAIKMIDDNENNSGNS